MSQTPFAPRPRASHRSTETELKEQRRPLNPYRILREGNEEPLLENLTDKCLSKSSVTAHCTVQRQLFSTCFKEAGHLKLRCPGFGTSGARAAASHSNPHVTARPTRSICLVSSATLSVSHCVQYSRTGSRRVVLRGAVSQSSRLVASHTR